MGSRAFPRRWSASRSSGGTTSPASWRRSTSSGSTRATSPSASSTLRPASTRWPTSRSTRRSCGASGTRRTGSTARAVRAEIDSPTYLGGVWQKTGVGILDPARLAWGLAAAAESLGAQDPRGDAGSRHRGGRRRRLAAHPGWTGPRATRGARDIRVPADRAVDPPLRRPGLRLRARDGAALGGAARRRGLEEPAGRGRLRQPVPLLPADGRRPHSLGRLRRRLQLPQRRWGRISTSGRRPSRCWPGTSSPPSRSWRESGSRTGGAVQSTRAAASA